MGEIRNQKEVFEGVNRRKKGVDRRKAPRRKSDWIMIIAKYLAVAVAAVLLVKYFG